METTNNHNNNDSRATQIEINNNMLLISTPKEKILNKKKHTFNNSSTHKTKRKKTPINVILCITLHTFNVKKKKIKIYTCLSFGFRFVCPTKYNNNKKNRNFYLLKYINIKGFICYIFGKHLVILFLFFKYSWVNFYIIIKINTILFLVLCCVFFT